jgi:hypothetical protein
MQLTNQEIFDRHSHREWFALGLVVTQPYQTLDTPPKLGCQMLSVVDVESGCFIGVKPLPRPPGAITAAEVIEAFDGVFDKHGTPKVGVVVMPSVWQSAAAYVERRSDSPNIQNLNDLGLMNWPSMCEGDRFALAMHFQQRGLQIEWSEDDVPPVPTWRFADD